VYQFAFQPAIRKLKKKRKQSALKEILSLKGFLQLKPLQMQYQLFQVMARVTGLDHQVAEV